MFKDTFNRPGVAGAVLQTPSPIIQSVSQSVNLFLPILSYLIIICKAWELGNWNFERMFTPHNMSHVMYHMSHVMCHVSHVTYHMSCFFCFFQWRVCYQRDLTCLVLILTLKFAIETYTIKILFVFLFLKCSNSDFFITFQKHSKEFEVQLESNNLRKRIRKRRKETCPSKKMILKKNKKKQLEVIWYEEQSGGVWHYSLIFRV